LNNVVRRHERGRWDPRGKIPGLLLELNLDDAPARIEDERAWIEICGQSPQQLRPNARSGPAQPRAPGELVATALRVAVMSEGYRASVSRVRRALTRGYGKQVPSGWPLYGWMFWLIGAFLTLLGLGALVTGGLVLGSALMAGGLLLGQTFSDAIAPPK